MIDICIYTYYIIYINDRHMYIYILHQGLFLFGHALAPQYLDLWHKRSFQTRPGHGVFQRCDLLYMALRQRDWTISLLAWNINGCRLMSVRDLFGRLALRHKIFVQCPTRIIMNYQRNSQCQHPETKVSRTSAARSMASLARLLWPHQPSTAMKTTTAGSLTCNGHARVGCGSWIFGTGK